MVETKRVERQLTPRERNLSFYISYLSAQYKSSERFRLLGRFSSDLRQHLNHLSQPSK